MILKAFLNRLKSTPDTIEFTETIDIIDLTYDFAAAQFSNGNAINQAGDNTGSCKIFAFGQLNGLTEQQTLACFGTYYRDDVVKHPNGSDHQNIRQFMLSGWQGIHFESQALRVK